MQVSTSLVITSACVCKIFLTIPEIATRRTPHTMLHNQPMSTIERNSCINPISKLIQKEAHLCFRSCPKFPHRSTQNPAIIVPAKIF